MAGTMKAATGRRSLTSDSQRSAAEVGQVPAGEAADHRSGDQEGPLVVEKGDAVMKPSPLQAGLRADGSRPPW